MNENIVYTKISNKIFVNEINANYGSYTMAIETLNFVMIYFAETVVYVDSSTEIILCQLLCLELSFIASSYR